ncbi:MAG: DUF983 domain-containing protein [Proteobacteria bacterium]|nr:DUF983 domain-containing protein [Pseudomonadota bacterium]
MSGGPPVSYAPVSLAHAALRCRCPRCGRGALFKGVLTIRESCPECGLDFSGQDAGDAPAVGVIFILGAVLVIAAFWVDVRFEPPLWVHAILWPAVGLPLTIVILRPLKAAVVALQYRHRRSATGL